MSLFCMFVRLCASPEAFQFDTAAQSQMSSGLFSFHLKLVMSSLRLIKDFFFLPQVSIVKSAEF